jgi:hypothetical protein
LPKLPKSPATLPNEAVMIPIIEIEDNIPNANNNEIWNAFLTLFSEYSEIYPIIRGIVAK